MKRNIIYERLIELAKRGNKLRILVPTEEIKLQRQKQYPTLKDFFEIGEINGIKLQHCFIDEASSLDNCYLEYVDGYLTCTYNHKIGEECLMNGKEN